MTVTSPSVRFQAIFDELTAAASGETLYLHKPTGQLQMVSESSVAGLCDVDEKAIPEKEKAYIDRIRHILISDEWVALPGFVHAGDFAALRAFAALLPDESSQQQRLRSLIKASFFHPIQDFLEEAELEDDWDLFRKRRFYHQLKDCLSRNGVVLTGIET